MPMRWSKKLAPTDAHDEAGSRNMPFRFTGSGRANHRTWFREVLFADANWEQEEDKEVALVNVHVIVDGNDLGVRQMTVDHSDARYGHNSGPTTYLHFDEETVAELQGANFVDKFIVIERDDAGNYKLTIQDNAPIPPHLP